jgi:insertion element IS1 protein InsB
MNPTLAFCPNLACPARGQAGKGNIGMDSHKEKRLICRQYGETFTDVIPAERHKAITKYARKTNPIERFNNTLRQRVSRLVRETLSFSKKLAYHIGALKYFICHYNLAKAAALPV